MIPSLIGGLAASSYRDFNVFDKVHPLFGSHSFQFGYWRGGRGVDWSEYTRETQFGPEYGNAAVMMQFMLDTRNDTSLREDTAYMRDFLSYSNGLVGEFKPDSRYMFPALEVLCNGASDSEQLHRMVDTFCEVCGLAEGSSEAEAAHVFSDVVYGLMSGRSLPEIDSMLSEKYPGMDTWVDAELVRGTANDDGFVIQDMFIGDKRPAQHINRDCWRTLMAGLKAGFEGVSFEDAVRNAVSLGGDSPQVAAVAAAVAGQLYMGRDHTFVAMTGMSSRFIAKEYEAVFEDFDREIGGNHREMALKLRGFTEDGQGTVDDIHAQDEDFSRRHAEVNVMEVPHAQELDSMQKEGRLIVYDSVMGLYRNGSYTVYLPEWNDATLRDFALRSKGVEPKEWKQEQVVEWERADGIRHLRAEQMVKASAFRYVSEALREEANAEYVRKAEPGVSFDDYLAAYVQDCPAERKERILAAAVKREEQGIVVTEADVTRTVSVPVYDLKDVTALRERYDKMVASIKRSPRYPDVVIGGDPKKDFLEAYARWNVAGRTYNPNLEHRADFPEGCAPALNRLYFVPDVRVTVREKDGVMPEPVLHRDDLPFPYYTLDRGDYRNYYLPDFEHLDLAAFMKAAGLQDASEAQEAYQAVVRGVLNRDDRDEVLLCDDCKAEAMVDYEASKGKLIKVSRDMLLPVWRLKEMTFRDCRVVTAMVMEAKKDYGDVGECIDSLASSRKKYDDSLSKYRDALKDKGTKKEDVACLRMLKDECKAEVDKNRFALIALMKESSARGGFGDYLKDIYAKYGSGDKARFELSLVKGWMDALDRDLDGLVVGEGSGVSFARNERAAHIRQVGGSGISDYKAAFAFVEGKKNELLDEYHRVSDAQFVLGVLEGRIKKEYESAAESYKVIKGVQDGVKELYAQEFGEFGQTALESHVSSVVWGGADDFSRKASSLSVKGLVDKYGSSGGVKTAMESLDARRKALFKEFFKAHRAELRSLGFVESRPGSYEGLGVFLNGSLSSDEKVGEFVKKSGKEFVSECQVFHSLVEEVGGEWSRLADVFNTLRAAENSSVQNVSSVVEGRVVIPYSVELAPGVVRVKAGDGVVGSLSVNPDTGRLSLNSETFLTEGSAVWHRGAFYNYANPGEVLRDKYGYLSKRDADMIAGPESKVSEFLRQIEGTVFGSYDHDEYREQEFKYADAAKGGPYAYDKPNPLQDLSYALSDVERRWKEVRTTNKI